MFIRFPQVCYKHTIDDVYQSGGLVLPKANSLISAIVGGRKFFVQWHKDQKSKQRYIIVTDESKKTYRLYKDAKLDIGDGNSKFSFFIVEDFVTPDMGAVWRFFAYSGLAHVVFVILFSIFNFFSSGPATTKVDIDEKRVQDILAKIKKSPKPIVEAKPKPKPKPKPKQAAPKKIAKTKKQTPKPQKKPQKRPKTQRAARSPRPTPNKPLKAAGRLSAKRAPSTAKRTSNRKATRSRRVKSKKASATNALAFLSTGSAASSPLAAGKVGGGKKKGRRYDRGGFSAKSGKNGYLAGVANAKGVSGNINTKGSRNIKGTGGAVGGRGSGSGNVKGRVASGSLKGRGRRGGALLGRGLKKSGSGKINQSAVEKALAKNLHKLQYCYEKSLLANPSIRGNITMGWDINSSGRASGAKVVKSQLGNSKLHRCIAREINKIRFPKAAGGNVHIKYPFSFSSSAL